MAEEKRKIEWLILGRSIRGASHVRAGLPNQDAILCWTQASGADSPPQKGLPLILAVSDGHGSAKCFRSDVGAFFAVWAAVQEMLHLLGNQSDLCNLSLIKRTAEERLPQELVRKWEQKMKERIESIPFSSKELDGLEKKEGFVARKAVEANPLLAYGATLLSVLVTEAFILYLQLGDGDILTVSETGEVTRPLPRDERLFANETTSLCSPDAWRDFRVRFQPLVSPPALILLSTDGYANSFRDEASFLKVGSDLLKIFRSGSLTQVDDCLEMWLNEASQVGSGDDITLGIVRCGEIKEKSAKRGSAHRPSYMSNRTV